MSCFGHELSDKGVQPDLKKIAAIQEMEPPRNRQELETLLAMVNYLAKFTPNVAERTSPMRSLLKKDSEFAWECAQKTAFDKIGNNLSKTDSTLYSNREEGRQSPYTVHVIKSSSRSRPIEFCIAESVIPPMPFPPQSYTSL